MVQNYMYKEKTNFRKMQHISQFIYNAETGFGITLMKYEGRKMSLPNYFCTS